MKKNIPDITAIILTFNEEKHIARCLKSLKDVVKNIVIIDSFSKDRTKEIAKKYNVKFYQRKFINQAKQINWGLKKIKFSTKWLLRIDADEILSNQLKKKLKKKLKHIKRDTKGISFKRVIKFLDKEILYGGTSPHNSVRLWMRKYGVCDNSLVDEQILVNGKIEHLNEKLIDHNLNGLKWWIKKHNNYAKREALNYLIFKKNKINFHQDNVYKNKKNKLNFYYKFPIFIRPLLLFLFRYFLQLGFLSGWKGLIFCILQTFWFRFKVDLNIINLNYLNKTKNKKNLIR